MSRRPGRARDRSRVAARRRCRQCSVGSSPGAPVRLAEAMEMRYYRSERELVAGHAVGRHRRGRSRRWPARWPTAPRASRGLTLRYRDAAGEPVADPAVVRAIEVALVGVTDRPIYGRELRAAAGGQLRAQHPGGAPQRAWPVKRGRRGMALPLALHRPGADRRAGGRRGSRSPCWSSGSAETRCMRCRRPPRPMPGVAAVVGGWRGPVSTPGAGRQRGASRSARCPAAPRYAPAVVRLNGQLFLLRVGRAPGAMRVAACWPGARWVCSCALPTAWCGGPAAVRPLRDRPWLLPGP